MHFSDAITEYSFDCKVRKPSAKTISNYQKQLRYLHRAHSLAKAHASSHKKSTRRLNTQAC